MNSTDGIPRRHVHRRRDPGPTGSLVRMRRILSLIVFLSGGYRTINQIARRLDVSPRTVHRYLNEVNALGLEVDTRFGKRHSYRITNTREFFGLTEPDNISTR